MTLCRTCYREEVAPGRVALGLFSCLLCGEKAARKVKHAITPVSKSNYIYAHTKEDVMNPYSHKGTR